MKVSKLINRLAKNTLVLGVLIPSVSYAGVFPVVARFNGVGATYGAGYQTKVNNTDIVLGGVGGDLTGYGALVRQHFTKNWEVSLGLGSVNDIKMSTTYLRGLDKDEDNVYIQKMNVTAYALGTSYYLFNDLFKLSASFVNSTVSLNGYENESGDEVELPGANLFDIETQALRLGTQINFYDNARQPELGVGFDLGVTNMSGRTGQSDQQVLDYGLTGLYPINKVFRVGVKAKYSDAFVKVNDKYDSEAEVRNELGVNCSSIADATKRAECTQLEAQLVNYIVENNLKGTATPLGGSNFLRSFREFRFKAAHTAVYSLEFKTKLSELFASNLFSGDRYLDFVVFYDQGHASDDKLELFKESKFSNGGSLNFVMGANSIQLQAASGSDNTSGWSLGFGKSF